MKNLFFTFSLIFIFSSAVFSQIPTDGLAGYWSFSGNANDESGNNHNGTVTGATLTLDRFGNENSAYSFDGVDDRILVNNTIGNFEESDFTISLWLKINELPEAGHGQYLGKRSAGTHGNYWNTGINLTGECGFEINEATGDDRNVLRGGTSMGNFTWNHIVITRTGNKYIQYFNGIVDDSLTGHTVHNINNTVTLTFGVRYFNSNLYGFYKGMMDDIRMYYRALDENEIQSLYHENECSDTTINDTMVFAVSSAEYESYSPGVFLESIDSLSTVIGGCDSIVRHYSKFIFLPNHCTDTTTIFDTTYVTVTDSVSVTDTLIIDAVLTGIAEPDNINTLKIYPNPAKDYIYINTGEYAKMAGYQLKIFNQLGAAVFETFVEQPLYEINLSSWSGTGLYFVQVIDGGGNVIEIRKIILQ